MEREGQNKFALDVYRSAKKNGADEDEAIDLAARAWYYSGVRWASGGFERIDQEMQQSYYEEIYQCQNRIESYKQKIRAEIQDIQVYKQKLDEAFNQYIE